LALIQIAYNYCSLEKNERGKKIGNKNEKFIEEVARRRSWIMIIIVLLMQFLRR